MKKFEWQIAAGAILLVLLIGNLFLPRMVISGDKYISVAMDVNEYAKEKDSKAAKKAGVDKTLKKYKEGSKARKSEAKKFDKEIDKKTDRISGLRLGKWALTVKSKLKFPGIKFEKGKEIKKSHVQNVFKLMGVMIYLPIFLAVFALAFMLIRRKDYGVLLLVSGIVSLICDAVMMFVIPGMIWSKVSSYIQSFTLISKDVLVVKGVGKYTIEKMVREFSSIGFFMELVLGILLVVAGILFMTVLKPAPEYELQDDAWDRNDWNLDMGGQGQVMNETRLSQEIHQAAAGAMMGQDMSQVVMNPAMNSATSPVVNPAITPKGILRGIKGQYAGFEMEFDAGEEIVFGRDPRYCKLIFEYPKVSRRHCGVSYDASTGKYRVIDYSSNGTSFSNGQSAKAGSYTVVEPGTVIYLANNHEAIRLG